MLYGSGFAALGRVLIKKGIQLVLAMRYSISVSAVQILMKTLYENICQGKDIEYSIAQARKELFRSPTRKAAYNRHIELQDWLLPVVYQNGTPDFRLRNFTLEEELAFVNQRIAPIEIRQSLPYGFWGRDLDILKIEKKLLTQNNILLLQGMGGAGKTTLIKYLLGWWLKTGFVEKVFYFGYDQKAYLVEDFIKTIAQSIYLPSVYETFRLLPESIQRQRIIDALNSNEYALVLDNAESITGVNLAIKNTLNENQRTELQYFLAELKGGRSRIIIGSRSSETWLKANTFSANQWTLRGLDEEAAKNFADAIIKDLGIPIEYIVKDEYFEQLLKLLAGFPLALKAILPNLKNKTAEKIFKELEHGLEGLDTKITGDKTESIVKCIEYSYSNLSEETKKLLLILLPFQSTINVAPKSIEIYMDELRKTSTFKDYPFYKLNEVINQLKLSGLASIEYTTSSIQFLKFQPLFSYFLKDFFNNLALSKQQDLEKAFISFYNVIGEILTNQNNSGNPKLIRAGLLVSEKEFENIIKAIKIKITNNQSIVDIHPPIYEYLFSKNQYGKALDFFLLIRKTIEGKLEKNNTIQLLNYLAITSLIGSIYTKMNEFSEAKNNYYLLLNILEKNKDILDKKVSDLMKASTHQNLGVIEKMMREYEAAEKNCLKSLEIYNLYKILESQAEINQNLGNIKRLQEKYPEAIKYSNIAVCLYTEIRNEKKLADIYLNLGLIKSHLKNFDEAEKFYMKAAKIYEKFEDITSLAEIYQNLGINFLQCGYLQRAKNCFDLSLNYFAENEYQQGKIFMNLGIIALKEKNYKKTNSYSMKSLEIAVKYKNYWDIGKNLNNLYRISKLSQSDIIYKKTWEKLETHLNENEINQVVECVQQLSISEIDKVD